MRANSTSTATCNATITYRDAVRLYGPPTWYFSRAERRCVSCHGLIPIGESFHGFRHYNPLPVCTRCAANPEPEPTPSTEETVRFAIAHRLPVELGYNSTSRVIEPYAITRTRDGNLLLHAIRTDCQEQRTYRVDRMEAVAILGEVA